MFSWYNICQDSWKPFIGPLHEAEGALSFSIVYNVSYDFCWAIQLWLILRVSNRHCLPTLHAAFMVFTVSVFPLTGVGDKVTSEPPNNSKTLYLDNKEGRHLVWDGFYTVMFVEVPTWWIQGCVGLYWVDLSAVSTVLFTSWHCTTSQLDTVEKKRYIIRDIVLTLGVCAVKTRQEFNFELNWSTARALFDQKTQIFIDLITPLIVLLDKREDPELNSCDTRLGLSHPGASQASVPNYRSRTGWSIQYLLCNCILHWYNV